LQSINIIIIIIIIPKGTKAFTFPGLVETDSGQIPITSTVKAFVPSSMMALLKMARTGLNTGCW